MRRKDCDNTRGAGVRIESDGRVVAARHRGRAISSTVGAAIVLLAARNAPAGSVRLWPSAVVISDTVRLNDVCELRGFSREEEPKIAQLTVTGAPAPGGSRIVHIDLVRSVITSSGTNMAFVTVGGATRCAVSRPSEIPKRRKETSTRDQSEGGARPGGPDVSGASGSDRRKGTLREAVVDYCNALASRYGASAEVTFDRTPEQVLDLSGPRFSFRVRGRGGAPVGLVPLEVNVLADEKVMQTVPIVVQVVMRRRVVVARRSINLGASIEPGDIDLVSLSFNRVDALGLGEVSSVIGQRAKRMISAGAVVESDMLEPVPLVRRGQLVTLTSVAGAVRVVTTAKATADGLLHEVVKVRSVKNKRLEFDAIVTGPGNVRIASSSRSASARRVALRGGP